MPKIGSDNLKIGRAITKRFSEAKDKLKEIGKYKNEREFASKVCTNRGNLQVAIDSDTQMVALYTLAHMSTRFDVNVHWLFTGKGDMFDKNEATIILDQDKNKLMKQITERFTEFLQIRIDKGEVASIYSLAEEMQYPSQHIYDLKAGKNNNIPYNVCLYMMTRYRMNPAWLLTGIGSMYG